MFCSFSVEPKNKKISYGVVPNPPFSPVFHYPQTQNMNNNNNKTDHNVITSSDASNHMIDANQICKKTQSFTDFSSSNTFSTVHNVTGGTKKRKWTAEEDFLLMQAVNAFGVDNWNLVAQRIESRTGKQCRERWMSNMCPTLIKDTWSPQEDLILIQKQSEFGNKWTLIHNFLPGRSNTAIKNRWKCLCRRNTPKHGQDFTKIFNITNSVSKTHSRTTIQNMHSGNSLPKIQQPKQPQNNIQEIIDSLFEGDCWNELEATLSVKA